jgi:hypothetical protein
MIPELPSQIVNKPEEQRQDNRNNDAACDGDKDAPVFRAELQIAGEFEQAEIT